MEAKIPMGPMPPDGPNRYKGICCRENGGLLAGSQVPECGGLERGVPHPKIAYFPDPSKAVPRGPGIAFPSILDHLLEDFGLLLLSVFAINLP